ncbi:FAD-dependent oxidoreductase [Thermogymnomonas acidicola]|uniref:FAD-dependent oxidoreductase n=1 Tax=Thermogymnomonas acidicola TaxID=399579 RepID=UPI001396964C|nr:NAD-binding protein [Thermogymnomonas acidicola]
MPRYSGGDLVVAGGGVKGMEAALYASKLGLRVTLYERAGQLGGQLLHIFDERKKREFSRLLDYYRYALEKAGGVQVVLGGEEFRGGKDALLCTPEVTYSEVKPVGGGELRIDSNIYMYHDAALRYAGEAEVTMTERSLSSLDRARAMGFRKAAEARGVRFVRSLEDPPTVRLIVREQYDLRAAMVSGRKAVDDMLALEGNLYL